MNSLKEPIKKLMEVFPHLLRQDFILFCGAGISIPSPSCAPSWWQLTEEILESFFQRVPEDFELPKDMIIRDPNKQPEAICENFANFLDVKWYEVFSALNVSSPNAVHQAIAMLAASGKLKACFTTNFDVYLERALRELHVDFELLVDNADYDSYFLRNGNNPPKKFLLCKIHGTIDRPESIVSVASVYKTAKGFAIPKAKILDALLSQFPILFLGYSGYDFGHGNYRKFWERTAPKVKEIYWNRRPGEVANPQLDEIFEEIRDRVHFVEGTLPKDLVESLGTLGQKYTMQATESTTAQDESRLSAQAKLARAGFFQKWAQTLPEPHVLGLAISESVNFSQRFKDVLKDMEESAAEKKSDTESFDITLESEKIKKRFENKEIGVQEYVAQNKEIKIKYEISMIRGKFRPAVRKLIDENKIPGITDIPDKCDHFLVCLRSFLSNQFSWQEAVELALEYTRRYQETAGKSDDASVAENIILTNLLSMVHPNKALWEPSYRKMQECKARFLRKETNLNEFSSELAKIVQEIAAQKMGYTFNPGRMLEKMVATTAAIQDDAKFADACGAFMLTVISSAGSFLLQEFMMSKEFSDIIMSVFAPTISKEEKNSRLSAFDNLLRKRFAVLLERAGKLGDSSLAGILLEVGILYLWTSSTMNLGTSIPGKHEEYQKMWESGEYPKKMGDPDIYRFLRARIEPWFRRALRDLPTRFIQKFCLALVWLAESGEDFELARLATQRSLEMTGNIVTEATPTNVPGGLAGFYERKGEKKNALRNYLAAVEAMKTIYPENADVVLYRAALLLGERGTKGKRKALEIIGKYHPEFEGNMAIFYDVPARNLCVRYAEKLAKELNYESAREAVRKLSTPTKMSRAANKIKSFWNALRGKK